MSAHPTARRSGTVITTRVDARWLYNNFFVGIVLLDARTSQAFEANTLQQAISIPPREPACSSMAELERELPPRDRLQFTITRRTLSHIVIFADGDGASVRWQHVVQDLLIAEGLAACVSVLDGGFQAFCARYAFYTTQYQRPRESLQDASSGKRVTYPNEVLEDFLYLGNMWQAQSQQVVQDLGITHIVNATLDLGNLWEHAGISYCDVKIPDDTEADIAQFFDPVFRFIEQARQSQSQHAKRRHRVLVHCTQGISRSATLVIMYLMRSQQWSLVTAFNATRESRPVIVPNDGFFRALLAEERRLFKNRNSLEECELDELLRGLLPERPLPDIRYHAATNTLSSAEKCSIM